MSVSGDAFFERVCAGTGIALIVVDADHRIVFWNSAAGRLFERTASEVMGEDIECIVPVERQDFAHRILNRVLQQREVSEFEMANTTRAGQRKRLAFTISPVDELAENQGHVSICVRDVTHGATLLRDEANSERMASLGMMAGAAAHHFNNLIGGITTSIDFALAADQPDMLRRALQTTVKALGRISDITYTLAAFAEGDHSETPLGPLSETVGGFLEARAAQWEQQKAELIVQLERIDGKVPVKRVDTIVELIIQNACEAMPEGGKVWVTLKKLSPKRARLTVQDEGTGIDPAHIRHVFDPFFTTKSHFGFGAGNHAGLGLSIVHGIVKELGGKVSAKNVKPTGSRFDVILPLQAD